MEVGALDWCGEGGGVRQMGGENWFVWRQVYWADGGEMAEV